MKSSFHTEVETPKKDLPRISGSEAVIRSFLAEGVETIFGYPGGAIIPVYNALYDYRDKINHILVRHEQCAIHAAQGYARATGRTGVCIVTSGPGATNTVTGLADALLDSTPIVLISGQVASSTLGTDAFQEINFIEITQSVTKWNCQVKRAEDIPAAIAKAFYIASTGRPGPVVIDITKDAQAGFAEFEYNPVKFIRSYQPYPEVDNDQIMEAVRLINFARKPMALIGQGVILGGAEQELKEFLEKSGIPAASTLLGLSALPTDHPQSVGMLGLHGYEVEKEVVYKNFALALPFAFRCFSGDESIDDATIEQMIVEYNTIYREESEKLVELFDGVVETLDHLTKAGVKVVITSNNVKPVLRRLTTNLGIAEYIDDIVSVEDVENVKPAPDIALEVLRRYNISGEEALVVGDATLDMDMGREAGCHLCGVSFGSHTPEMLRERGARYIIDHFSEIEKIVLG